MRTRLVLDKSLLTNAASVALMVIGMFSPYYGEHILNMGVFAFSGAITNWLAVYMLFERVPLLYGSGVIPERFTEFKLVIKRTIMEQFFTPENIHRFIAAEEASSVKLINLEPLLAVIDYDRIYDSLRDAILNSSFGGLIRLAGGAKKLEALREPFTTKLRDSLLGITRSETFNTALANSINEKRLSEDMQVNIERILDQRLDELTPGQVKAIVEEIIRRHLGWLVVWGGVFGGLIGVVFSLLS